MKKLNKFMLIFLIFIGLILINKNVFATTGKVNETTIRLRESATTDSSVLQLISLDEEVEILSEEGEWYKVEYNSKGKELTGYIRKDMLSVETQDVKNEGENKEQVENNIDNSQEADEVETSIESNQLTIAENNSIQKGYIGNISNNVQIKILPAINSTSLGEIQANSQIKVVEIINKWCKVETDFTTGWILLSKINTNIETTEQETVEAEVEEPKEEQKEEQKPQETKTLYVSTETLNIREKPETGSKILKQLSLNDSVELLEKVDDTWSKIRKNGEIGYTASKYLSETKTEVTSRSLKESRTNETENEDSNNTTNNDGNSSKGEEVVAFAKQYLGYKYVSGKESPSAGFDCSGFTYYVYKNFGITLNRASGAQASNGVSVSKDNLQLGDLVLFQGWGTTSIGHVGIYIGGNSFIHAANADKGVIITSLSDSYYSKKYVTARRVLN